MRAFPGNVVPAKGYQLGHHVLPKLSQNEDESHHTAGLLSGRLRFGGFSTSGVIKDDGVLLEPRVVEQGEERLRHLAAADPAQRPERRLHDLRLALEQLGVEPGVADHLHERDRLGVVALQGADLAEQVERLGCPVEVFQDLDQLRNLGGRGGVGRQQQQRQQDGHDPH